MDPKDLRPDWDTERVESRESLQAGADSNEGDAVGKILHRGLKEWRDKLCLGSAHGGVCLVLSFDFIFLWIRWPGKQNLAVFLCIELF